MAFTLSLSLSLSLFVQGCRLLIQADVLVQRLRQEQQHHDHQRGQVHEEPVEVLHGGALRVQQKGQQEADHDAHQR